MTQKIEVRQPNANFDLLVKDGLTELYVDGASSVALGFPMSKVVLHTVTPPINEPIALPEKREAVARLVIPTAALLELALNTIKSAAQVKDQLSAGSAAISSQLSSFLAQLPEFDPLVANLGEKPDSSEGK
jgi:hypothetical protein